MTDDLTLRSLLREEPGCDLLREMIGFTAERLMELEVLGLTGCWWPRRALDLERINLGAQRLPRPGLGDPRLGRAEDSRKGAYPASLEAGWPRRLLAAVIQEAYIQGVIDPLGR